jgi:hypothetical protein
MGIAAEITQSQIHLTGLLTLAFTNLDALLCSSFSPGVSNILVEIFCRFTLDPIFPDTVKDFKKENDSKKEVLNNNNKSIIKPYERVYNGVEVYYKFYKFINQYDLINENDIKTVSED